MMEASAGINTDFTKARAAAQRAVDKANALVFRCTGWSRLRNPLPARSIHRSVRRTQLAIRECDIALQTSRVAGDRNGEAMMMNNLAGIYYQQGNLARAEKMWHQAILEFRQIGNPEGVATAFSNIGSAEFMKGNLLKRRSCWRNRSRATKLSKTTVEWRCL